MSDAEGAQLEAELEIKLGLVKTNEVDNEVSICNDIELWITEINTHIQHRLLSEKS